VYFCWVNLGHRIFNFYINSSIHVSLAVVSLLAITGFYFKETVTFNLTTFVFFGSITGYNFVKYSGIAKLHWYGLTSSLKSIQLFSLVSFLLAIYFLFKLPFQVIFLALFSGILTVLYALPIFPKRRNLRAINGLKIYVIALVWCLITVFLPVVNADLPLDFAVIILGIQRFLFVFVLILPFEIRDLKYDDDALGTIPRRIGVKNTKYLGFVILFIIFLLEIITEGSGVQKFISTSLIVISTFLLLQFSSTNQKKYYASFFVEAIPIAWIVLLWVIMQLF